jgi:hypothetical protein
LLNIRDCHHRPSPAVRFLFALASVGLPLLAVAGPSRQALAAPDIPATEVIPLDLSGPRPLAMLTIGSSPPVPVIFDTGATGNVLDADYARSRTLSNLGSTTVASPAGGMPVQGFRTVIEEGRLGGALLRHVSAIVVPLPMPRARGVISPYTFSGRLVSVDFAKGQIRVTPKGRAQVPVGSGFAYGPEGLPAVPVTIGATTYPGHIDSGSNGFLTVPLALADHLPLDAPPHVIGRARLAGGEEREVTGARIRGIVRVGPLSFENPDVVFVAGLQRVNVGTRALSGATILLDPTERLSWIISREGTAAP